MATLLHFDRSVSVGALTTALRDEGCAIIDRLVDASLISAITAELDGDFERVEPGATSRTKRMCRIPVRSPTSHAVIAQPVLLEAIGELLRGEAYHFMLQHSEASLLLPGAPAQPGHRDTVNWHFRHPCPPIGYAVVWARSDFTAENGATRVIPGSHLWDDERKPLESEYVACEMTTGSAVIFDAAIYHGYGANRTADQVRASLIFNYGVSWLMPIENPWLAVPPALARTMSRTMQDLLGYRNHGYIDHYEFMSPAVLLEHPGGHAAADRPERSHGISDKAFMKIRVRPR